MPRCSEEALETAIKQLSEHARDNRARAGWISVFLAAARMRAAGYEPSIHGADEAVEDLFVLLPENEKQGRLNPFYPGKSKWMKVVGTSGIRSGQATVWNTSTRSGSAQAPLFKGDHIENGLRDDAIDVLLEKIGDAQLPAREALAIFLTRDKVWTDEPSEQELVEAGSEFVGLTVDEFARITAEHDFPLPVLGEPEWSASLLEESELGPLGRRAELAEPLTDNPAAEPVPLTDGSLVTSLEWTRMVARHPLREADVDAIADRVLAILDKDNIVLPDSKQLVRRCVIALLLGHLILQGPPGTGKTTLARALAEAFDVNVVEATATSEWSPFHVVGGFRPSAERGLVPVHGKVVEAALHCAETVRSQLQASAIEDVDLEEPQGTWLFIDEFNRADIDKAIGSLYTLLSSCDAAHLDKTPIDLWFESDVLRQKLWVPARFRIIGAMNDLDTSFVNAISQGLMRRFHFVTVTPPSSPPPNEADGELTVEMRTALRQAHRWITATYASSEVGTFEEAIERLRGQLRSFDIVLAALRTPDSAPGWPIGTAQVVDVLKYVLASIPVAAEPGEISDALDIAIADRLVPQMSQIDDQQEKVFREAFKTQGLKSSSEALGHMLNPHVV